MIQEKRWAAGLVALVGAGYLAAVFPWLFFRHDDWWILGNSVRYLPQDWSFAWEPMLYFNNTPLVWFFRPGFKAMVYLFYSAFGFHYGLWMATLLAIYGATLWIGYAVAERIGGNSRNGFWFVAATAGTWLIHFGSLAWMGEGMMNVPQAFLLMACTYAFLRGTHHRAWWVASWLSFILALAFKESSLFHTVFLAAMVLAEPTFTRLSLKKRAILLLPFAVLGAAYLVVRLGWMPVSPSYHPDYTVDKIVRTLGLALGPVFLPLVLWALGLFWWDRPALGRFTRGLAGRAYYLPFLVVSISVYLGLDFFSPGWLLLLGTFCLLAVACGPFASSVSPSVMLRFALVLSVVSAVPIGWRLNAMGWSHWHRAQTEVFDAIRSAPTSTTHVYVRPCENPSYPGVTFDRVVANEESVRQIWYLTHGQSIPVTFLYCDSKTPAEHGQLLLDWKFPESLKVTSLP
jgi:hypothetical protein